MVKRVPSLDRWKVIHLLGLSAGAKKKSSWLADFFFQTWIWIYRFFEILWCQAGSSSFRKEEVIGGRCNDSVSSRGLCLCPIRLRVKAGGRSRSTERQSEASIIPFAGCKGTSEDHQGLSSHAAKNKSSNLEDVVRRSDVHGIWGGTLIEHQFLLQSKFSSCVVVAFHRFHSIWFAFPFTPKKLYLREWLRCFSPWCFRPGPLDEFYATTAI